MLSFPFKPTADMLLCVTESVCQTLYNSGETRVVALDTSISFDRDWHTGLLYKLKRDGVFGRIFGLTNRLMKILLNGYPSESFHINLYISQRSIPGPISFLVLLNDPNYVTRYLC